MKNLGKLLLLFALALAPVGCAVEEDDPVTPAGPPATTGGGGTDLGGSIGGGATKSVTP